MNISQRDVMLLFTMALAIVAMSLVFPGLGIATDEDVDEEDIPELDVNSSQFDFSGDFPEAPGSPRTEDLEYREDEDVQFNQVWLEGDTSGGIEVALLPPSSGDPLQVIINDWDGGSVEYDERLNFTENNTTQRYYNESQGYQIEFDQLENDTDEGVYEVRMDVRQQVVEDNWLSNTPILGAAAEVGQATAATLGWFIEIAVWALVYVFDLIANAVGLMADVGAYLVGLLSWLIDSYTGIVSAASGWVSLFVALPGILLGAVLAKVVIIAVGLLPTT